MNKITIKADGPCEVTLNGERMIAPGTLVRVDTIGHGGGLQGAPREGAFAPDRVSIDMTAREAELVRSLVCKGYAGKGWPQTKYAHHTWLIACALHNSGFDFAEHFDGCADDASKEPENGGYANAERIAGGIRLTMDRDVAVTLRHLLMRLDVLGELGPVWDSLYSVGVYLDGTNRFTGTIRWKKKRLQTYQCEVGKTYRLAERISDGTYWEPVE